MTRRRPLPPVFEVARCVVLAIDPGREGGAAVWAPSGFALAERVKPGGESRIVESALRIAEAEELPLMVVGETWTFGGRGGDPRATGAMRAGLAARWGRWEGALLAAGVPARRVLRVNVRTWQARILGAPPHAKSEQRKAAAERVARDVARLDVTGDAADAVCIALWAARAGEVLDRIPKRRGAA